MDIYHVIGLMSGTSLDGLDTAYCRLQYEADTWKAEIIKAETIKYSNYWLNALSTAHELAEEQLIALHKEYGVFLGEQVNSFIAKNKLKPVDLIASHGHTVFHQPEKGFTFQLGDGAQLLATCGITTICDFRSADVALGGQGAPLVPIGDEMLFGDYDLCLNMGGFANISYSQGGKRLAFDICPVNIVLNSLAQQKGRDYDEDGNLACSGQLDNALLQQLEAIEFFHKAPPKSLGREWLEQVYLPVLANSEMRIEDKLRTVCENIALQIAKAIGRDEGKMLITGGGAFNKFLIQLIKEKTEIECVIPEEKLVNYKEALVFALLGVLRLKGEVNCLASVTGARRDSIGGVIHPA